jgi:hypothetical protein
MKCSEVKFNLSLYSDEILSADERGELDAHLDTCPLCRQDLSEYQSVRNGLRSLSRPTLASDILANLRSTIAAQLRPAAYGPAFRLIEDRRSWFEAWMMPSAVGTVASIVVGVFMLWAILFTARNPSEFASAAKPSGTSIMLARNNAVLGPDSIDLSPSEYADSRLAVAGESPSINPQGALIALTRSFVRGKMNDEEVVVVAEVFGNGLARITEVVEPTNDSRAIEQLERALDSDPTYAPFVPASYDKRSETTRVILKIQNVNVRTSLKAARRSIPDRRRS